jgi:hypothetical protein
MWNLVKTYSWSQVNNLTMIPGPQKILGQMQQCHNSQSMVHHQQNSGMHTHQMTMHRQLEHPTKGPMEKKLHGIRLHGLMLPTMQPKVLQANSKQALQSQDLSHHLPCHQLQFHNRKFHHQLFNPKQLQHLDKSQDFDRYLAKDLSGQKQQPEAMQEYNKTRHDRKPVATLVNY